jgi:hypothetical protein
VVYVDIDPVVCSHGQALLVHGDQVAMVRADLREPATVMRHPDVLALLDLTQPVAVVCAAVLHFVADEDDPYRIIAEYRDHMAPGSYLAISHGTTGTAEEDPDDVDLIDPGVVWINEWRPGPGFRSAGQPRSLRGGVGRRP